MRNYTLYWKDGKREEIRGQDLDDAFVRAELTRKKLENVAFYLEGSCTNYEFDNKTHLWKRKS